MIAVAGCAGSTRSRPSKRFSPVPSRTGRTGTSVIVDSEKVAKDAGTSKAQNIVMLGALLAATRCLTQETAGRVLEHKVKDSRLLELDRHALEAGLALTQGSYSNNWAGGDKGSIIWTLIANGSVENQLDPKANWLNTLKLAYGQTSQQKADPTGARYWETPQKSTDLINYESLLADTIGELFTGTDFEVNIFGPQSVLQFCDINLPRLTAIFVCHSGGYPSRVPHGDAITH